MKRNIFRLLLAGSLVVLTALAAFLWSSDFEKDPDPKAFYKIEAARLEADRSFFWLEVHLKKNGEEDLNLEKQPQLVTAEGVSHAPADSTFAGSPETGFSEIWYKFWLEKKDLEGTLKLKINEGELAVKTSQGVPVVKDGKQKVLRSADWGKTWLGF